MSCSQTNSTSDKRIDALSFRDGASISSVGNICLNVGIECADIFGVDDAGLL